MLIEYEKEVAVKPEYLSAKDYKKIVQNALSLKDTEIQKVICCMGSKTGDNYCSNIYRAKIQYITKEENRTDTLSIIIKSMPKSDSADFLESLETFSKERTIYYDILPRLEALNKQAWRFGPRIYHNIANPVNTLVFEDLAVSQYRMASREQGLDETHARLILKRLAQLHGSSMVLAERHPELSDGITNGMLAPVALENENGMLMRFFSTSAHAMIAEVSKWPGYESILCKIKKFVSNFRENLAATQAPTIKDKIKVLNHGDLWVNNMLFQYNENSLPINVIFVDFQMSFYGSPGIDLNYFFYTSLQLELLKTKRIELLTSYHNELCSTLEDLGFSSLKPTLEQVINEFQQRASYGFFASVCLLPTISLNKEISEDSCLENYMDEEFTKKKIGLMFQSERVQKTLKFVLKEFEELGVWS